MRIADVPPFVNQIEGRPVAVVISPPGIAFIVLRNRIGYIQSDEGCFQVIYILFVVEFRIVIADDY